MSEKRFYLLSYKNYPLYDSVEDKEYNARFRKQREKLCDLLNEWVAKCNQLESENEQLQKKIRVLSVHLLSDECALTDSQIRKIKGELDNV